MCTPTKGLTADEKAAREFLAELTTRIAIQPLPYLSGDEAAALASLRQLFDFGRATIKKYPDAGAFAAEVVRLLNKDVRPVTAKWHKAKLEGRLRSRDGSDDFRAELMKLRDKLLASADVLNLMAYGKRFDRDGLTDDKLPSAVVDVLMSKVLFGIAEDPARLPDVASINRSEFEEIADRRQAGGLIGKEAAQNVEGADVRANAVGLALSGGGIRSAAFCLGAVQVLAHRKLLRCVDFLSTVSGGGYTGSFLSSRMKDGLDESLVANPDGPDTEDVRHVRQHAQYLMVSGLKKQWSMVAGAFAGLLLNWTAPVGLVALLALVASCSLEMVPGVGWPDVLQAGGIACLGVLVLYGLSLRLDALVRGTGWLLAVVLGIEFVLAVAWLVDTGRTAVPEFVSDHAGAFGLSAIVAGAGPIILRFLPVIRTPAVRETVLKVFLWAAGILIPLVAIVLFYVFLDLARQPRFALGDLSLGLSGRWILTIFIAVCAFVSIFLLNINLTGPHQLYRNQLSRTFVEREPVAIPRLGDLRKNGSAAPYHLVNATVNLPSSDLPSIKERKSDFFLFSKRWCGARSIGYAETGKWKANGRDLDLSTAMAVSGAAMSSHMGLGSKPSLTALLTFLNVRLGFWLRRPGRGIGFLDNPGFLCLLREMTGVAMSQHRAWINLSDGGHIENMGLYELLRRRCKLVICIDGEADPQCTFHGLMAAVRHAQIDFGVQLDPGLDGLRPNPETKHSNTHFMFCRIRYPKTAALEKATGLLLYVKLSVTGNESELIRRYRTTHPEFPHQSTLDQFFDEEQFEAYRQLGVHALSGLFSSALVDDAEKIKSIDGWFRHLAANLLEATSDETEAAEALVKQRAAAKPVQSVDAGG